MTPTRIPTSFARLARRATLWHRLAVAAWEQLPDGAIRVAQTSPQFALAGFLDDLVAVAARDGYTAHVDGPWVNVWRGGYRQGWKQVRMYVVFVPRSEGVGR